MPGVLDALGGAAARQMQLIGEQDRANKAQSVDMMARGFLPNQQGAMQQLIRTLGAQPLSGSDFQVGPHHQSMVQRDLSQDETGRQWDQLDSAEELARLDRSLRSWVAEQDNESRERMNEATNKTSVQVANIGAGAQGRTADAHYQAAMIGKSMEWMRLQLDQSKQDLERVKTYMEFAKTGKLLPHQMTEAVALVQSIGTRISELSTTVLNDPSTYWRNADEKRELVTLQNAYDVITKQIDEGSFGVNSPLLANTLGVNQGLVSHVTANQSKVDQRLAQIAAQGQAPVQPQPNAPMPPSVLDDTSGLKPEPSVAGVDSISQFIRNFAPASLLR